MKKLLLILIYFFVSFEVKSDDEKIYLDFKKNEKQFHEELLDDVTMVVSPDSGDKCMNYEGNKGYLLSLNPLTRESFRTTLSNIDNRRKPILFTDYTINKYLNRRNRQIYNPCSGKQYVTN